MLRQSLCHKNLLTKLNNLFKVASNLLFNLHCAFWEQQSILLCRTSIADFCDESLVLLHETEKTRQLFLRLFPNSIADHLPDSVMAPLPFHPVEHQPIQNAIAFLSWLLINSFTETTERQ
jgi:hypothetical protein